MCYNRNRLKKGGIKMKQLRKTKIVGTIGPASENKLEELFEAGLNVTRVNYSHGSWDEKSEKTEKKKKKHKPSGSQSHSYKKTAENAQRPLPHGRINTVVRLRLGIINVVNFAHLRKYFACQCDKSNKNKLSLHSFFKNIKTK